MAFDDLDRRMRAFETVHDLRVLPGVRLIARLDGRNFARMSRDLQIFTPPFDERQRDMMLLTAEHLMMCGFNISYGWTSSDEISLLFRWNEDTFGRKERKLISILAGEGSAAFSVALGRPACFDCRLSQLPTPALVLDYFRWRSADAHRNAITNHCFWLLRRLGASAHEATERLSGWTYTQKNDLLFQHGINFNELPVWQRRGVGLVWEGYTKMGVNPQTGEPELLERRRIRRDLELPRGDAYDAYLRAIMDT